MKVTPQPAVPAPTKSPVNEGGGVLKIKGKEARQQAILDEVVEGLTSGHLKFTSYALAAEFFNAKAKEEETVVNITEVIKVYPWEGALATARAIKNIFGYTAQVPIKTIFGDVPPNLIAVDVDVDQTELVPWGQMKLPGIEGHVTTGTAYDDGRMVFQLSAKVKKRDEFVVHELADEIRREAKEHSVYRGKIFALQFTDDEGDVNPMPMPKFVDVTKVDPSQLVLNDDLYEIVDNELFCRIEYPDQYAAAGEPVRRGFLFAGPPGVGKTLICAIAAKKGLGRWTHIICKKAADLPTILKVAEFFAPYVLVSCEDIDRSASGERTVAVDQLLNQLDGVDTKLHQFILLLTSNDSDSIRPEMLRPGRIDRIIKIDPPNTAAAENLLRLACKGALLPGEDISEAADELSGAIPAIIEDVAKSARAYAINRIIRSGSELSTSSIMLTADDLYKAAIGKRLQRALLAPPAAGATAAQELGRELGKAFGEVILSGAEMLRNDRSQVSIDEFPAAIAAKKSR